MGPGRRRWKPGRWTRWPHGGKRERTCGLMRPGRAWATRTGREMSVVGVATSTAGGSGPSTGRSAMEVLGCGWWEWCCREVTPSWPALQVEVQRRGALARCLHSPRSAHVIWSRTHSRTLRRIQHQVAPTRRPTDRPARITAAHIQTSRRPVRAARYLHAFHSPAPASRRCALIAQLHRDHESPTYRSRCVGPGHTRGTSWKAPYVLRPSTMPLWIDAQQLPCWQVCSEQTR